MRMCDWYVTDVGTMPFISLPWADKEAIREAQYGEKKRNRANLPSKA